MYRSYDIKIVININLTAIVTTTILCNKGAVSCEFEAVQKAIGLSQTIPFYRTICRQRQNEEEVSYIIPLGRPMETLSSVMLIFFTI